MIEMTKQKINLFIDTEFNGFGGDLIAMAIVGYDQEFYEVIELDSDMPIDEWVKINVYPKLGKTAISYELFQKKLEEFLQVFPKGFNLIADWPDDLRYFLQSIMLSPGCMMKISDFEMKVDRQIDSFQSKIPHNALEDARAIKLEWEKRKRKSVCTR